MIGSSMAGSLLYVPVANDTGGEDNEEGGGVRAVRNSCVRAMLAEILQPIACRRTIVGFEYFSA